MAVTDSVSASALKAKCLTILNRLAPHQLESVVIRIKRTVAMLATPDRHAEAVRSIHGFMRGSVIIAEDADLTAPLLDQPAAAEGEPHG